MVKPETPTGRLSPYNVSGEKARPESRVQMAGLPGARGEKSQCPGLV